MHRLGSDCDALYLAGGANGQVLRQLLDREQIRQHVIDIAADTRESFSVHETSSGLDYRFVLPGPTVQRHEWEACLAYIAALDVPPRYLVASGGLPPGAPTDFYARVARLALERGSLLVLDTSGPALAAALAEGVYLFKPSLRELRGLSGLSLTTEDEWRRAAQHVVQAGQAQIVALSLGEDGALLVSADTSLRSQGLRVHVAGTIGAGDSFVGGLVWSLDQGHTLEEAFRYGMAAGAAALLSAGTALCDPADVRRLRDEVVITSDAMS
ncbi:MAG: hexose kinase [Pseudomonadota bacterium]|nr:hexose kinase [Pseudomonadota bacterium]